MKKLLICPHFLDYGGSQSSVHHWARHLNHSKYEVIILAMGKGGLSEKFESEYPVYYDDIEYPNIQGYIKQISPDIVHACPGGGVDHVYIEKAAELIPVTQTVMCPRPAGNKKTVVKTVVPSEFVFGLQKDIQNVLRIDHPFDISDYNAKYDRSHFKLPNDKILILSFGNPRRENKDFMKIAKAYKNKNVHFVIRTERKYRYFLGKDRITVINDRLDENEKISLFKMADIFLYPTSNEAYGIVFLEAMSQKTPIISYCDSAMPEVIGNGGLLAPKHDIKKMIELLHHLVTNPDQRRRIGENGYNLFVKRNQPQIIANKYGALFDEILGH
jgi:glycosyltransferase involved in cell wall biosynthesis